MRNTCKIKVRIVRADGSWRFNRLLWEIGDTRAYFASGSGFVILADMFREGCRMTEGWIGA